MSSDESSSDSSELARSSETTTTGTSATPSTSSTSLNASKSEAKQNATFFNASVSEASGVASGAAGAQVYMQKVQSNHFQLCQNLQIDLSDPVSARGDRLYFFEEANVCVLDRVAQRVSCLFNCRFAPQSIDVRYRRVVVCGIGDQLLIADAYTGRILHHRRPVGSHLTNVARLFSPPSVGSGVRIAAAADSDVSAAAADDNDDNNDLLGDDDDDDKVRASKRSARISKRLLSRLVDDWHARDHEPALHLLVGGNNDGVVVYSINDGGAVIASLPFPTYINEIRVSPDSSQFVALGDTDDIFFVDIVCSHGTATYARRCKREFEPPSPKHSMHPGGFSAAWSEDSKRVAVLREWPGVVNVLDVATLDVLAVLHGSLGAPLRVVAYDREFIALAEERGNVWVYDSKTFTACQHIDLLQLHTRVWNAVVPSCEAVVFPDALNAPDVAAQADEYLQTRRAVNGATGDFHPATVRYARYLQARRSALSRSSPFDIRCTGMVLVPGMLIVARPNIVVLHVRRAPSLAAAASALIIACRRVEHENDRRLVLYDWCVKAARRLVKAHNDVIQRVRRRRIAAATERYEALDDGMRAADSTVAAGGGGGGGSGGSGTRAQSHSRRRLPATAFATAAFSASRHGAMRASRATTTDDIDLTTAHARRTPTQPRVVGLANPMQNVTTVPLLDFDLGDVLAYRDMHRLLVSRFGVAFWQVTSEDFVTYNKLADIVATCIRMLANCIVREQSSERFEGSPCVPSSAVTVVANTTNTTSTATTTTTTTTTITENHMEQRSLPRLLGLFRGGQFVQVESPQQSVSSSESVSATPQSGALQSPTRRDRALEALRDDLPPRMSVAEALEQLPPIVLLPQTDMDLSALPRSRREALQRDARGVHCAAPAVSVDREAAAASSKRQHEVTSWQGYLMAGGGFDHDDNAADDDDDDDDDVQEY